MTGVMEKLRAADNRRAALAYWRYAHEYVSPMVITSLERESGGEGPEDEWLWAEPLGSQRFRVESTPFFAYGLSHGDVVRAEGEGDMPYPPDHPKMPGEPKRVQPSKDRDRPR